MAVISGAGNVGSGSGARILLMPTVLPSLNDDDRLTPAGATVLDFWRWALGDLRMNNARGYLAEFLVARAVQSPAPSRIEWASHDVTDAEGIRIEVKTSSYLQSWSQWKLSCPTFSLAGAAESWHDESGEWRVDPRGRVDVWVFCLQTCKEHEKYDPLDIDQWRFWVAPSAVIEALGQKSAALSTIERIAGPCMAWEQLRAAVQEAGSGHQCG